MAASTLRDCWLVATAAVMMAVALVMEPHATTWTTAERYLYLCHRMADFTPRQCGYMPAQ